MDDEEDEGDEDEDEGRAVDEAVAGLPVTEGSSMRVKIACGCDIAAAAIGGREPCGLMVGVEAAGQLSMSVWLERVMVG